MRGTSRRLPASRRGISRLFLRPRCVARGQRGRRFSDWPASARRRTEGATRAAAPRRVVSRESEAW